MIYKVKKIILIKVEPFCKVIFWLLLQKLYSICLLLKQTWEINMSGESLQEII